MGRGKLNSKLTTIDCSTMFRLNPIIALLLFISPSLCAAEENPLAVEAKEILRKNCAECHVGDSARSGVLILDYDSLIDDGHVVPEQPDASTIYQLMTSTGSDVMPPDTRPALMSEELETIRQWIAEGAAKFPADVSMSKASEKTATTEPAPEPNLSVTEAVPETPTETVESVGDAAPAAPTSEPAFNREEVLEQILQHIRTVKPADRPFVRYFSLRHLLATGITAERLQDHRHALTKAINHLSRERELVVPQAIDELAGGTIFWIDSRTAGWHQTIATSEAEDRATINAYDLFLLEYPYAILPETSDAFDRLLIEHLDDCNQVRPVPYLRGDWFCSIALQPPVYHDVLQLPRTIKALEEQLGVDVASNIESSRVRRAGMLVSGVSRNNRAVERHSQSHGYYWKSHDFRDNVGPENILADPLDFKPAGGEMIFSLPNGMQAYFVCDSRGNRIDAAPTEIVVDKFASDRVVRNGLGCIRCHQEGIRDFRDVVRKIVTQLPGSPGFDKRKTLEIYPEAAEWDSIIAGDRDAFMMAMKKSEIGESPREPLSVVTSHYLEDAITTARAAAELGVEKSELASVCRSRALLQLGLAPLAADSLIRRDTWEHNFSSAAEALGLGVPVIPIDAVKKTNFRSGPLAQSITFRTNKANNFFEPGDRLRISVGNTSGGPIQFELFGTSTIGEKVSLTDGVRTLTAGETFVFPELPGDGLEIRGGIGKESITLFATAGELPAGNVFSGENMDDRVIHPFYVSSLQGESIEHTAGEVMKQTIVIETR